MDLSSKFPNKNGFIQVYVFSLLNVGKFKECDTSVRYCSQWTKLDCYIFMRSIFVTIMTNLCLDDSATVCICLLFQCSVSLSPS